MTQLTHGTHVLLVDDDPTLNELLADILRHEGAQVTTAYSGRLAWETLKGGLPDIVVSDIMMDDGDGFWLLRQVRSDASMAHLPFIFLSAKAEPQDFRAGMDLGADDFLTKPVSRNALVSAIQLRLIRAGKATPKVATADNGESRGVTLLRELLLELQQMDRLIQSAQGSFPGKSPIGTQLQGILESHARLTLVAQSLNHWMTPPSVEQ